MKIVFENNFHFIVTDYFQLRKKSLREQ